MFTRGVLGLSRPKAMVMSLRDHSMLGEGFPLPGPSVKPSEHEPGKSAFLFRPHLPPFSCIACASVSWTSEVPGTDVKPTPGPARPQLKA